MKKVVFLFLILLISFSKSFSQESSVDNERTIGLTATLQSDQLDFLFPIWASERFVIAPNISMLSAQEVGSDIGIGFTLKSYLKDIEEAVPYIAFRTGTIIGIPKEGDKIYDFLLGAGFGGEYFFKPKFSLGIEIQGNFSISDEGSFRFGNPGNINFNTATALTTSIYF